ncbi:MAG TPA: ASPIC/UnbV domain-containing protein, partial [Flavobacteriales bacterium]|nr:ASPIC/UnbV domain-containing protein [Flavobacteriales bacterium]
LWINNCSNGNHFVTFHLTGTTSNKMGIGAKVKIFGPWGIQTREVRSGEAYGIQNSFDAHFGLGSNTTVDSVIVVWPSGTIDNLLNVAADQFVNITEGDFPVSVAAQPVQTTVNVYPNPNTGTFTIDLGNGQDAKIVIRDMSGRMVHNRTSTGRYNHFDLSNYDNGIYMYEVITANGRFSGRIVKQ